MFSPVVNKETNNAISKDLFADELVNYFLLLIPAYLRQHVT